MRNFLHRQSWCVAFLVLWMVLLAGPPIAAQDRRQSPAFLEKAAELLFKAGRYAEAAEKFREVIERYQEPEDVVATARWNLARCHEEMGDDEAALQAFLDFARHARNAKERQDAESKVAQVRDRLRAALTVEAQPAGATVRVDGQVAGTAPLAQPLRLDPGTHVVECTMEGFRAHSESVDLAPKENRTLRVSLEPMAGIVALSASGPLAGPVSVLVDGEERYQGGLPIEIRLSPGAHRIEVRHPDRPQPFRQDVAVLDGERVAVVVRFPVTAEPEVARPGPPVSPAPPRPTRPAAVVAEAPAPPVAASAALSAGLGFAHYQGRTARTHVTIEVGAGLRIRGVPWLRPDLALAASVEAPAMVLVRPGVRWYAGTWPLFVRTAGQVMVTPLLAGGPLVGLGVDVPLTGRIALLVEGDASLWPSAPSLVPVEFRVGVGYAF